MKRGIVYPTSRIKVDKVQEGQSIEEMIRKAMSSKEPIQGNATINFTERKDGILPQYDIRTDRFEMAMMAADRVHASEFAKRMIADGFEQNENGKWVIKATTQEVPEA